MTDSKWYWPEQIALFLLRVVAGLLFMQAGGMKILGWFGGPPHPGPLPPQILIGAYMELIGGLLMMIGLGVRPVAFLLSGEMAVAYWQFHAPKGAWPALNDGSPAVLYCFIFLFFAAYGAGRLSLDWMIRKGRVATE